jgi:putative transposase
MNEGEKMKGSILSWNVGLDWRLDPKMLCLSLAYPPVARIYVNQRRLRGYFIRKNCLQDADIDLVARTIGQIKPVACFLHEVATTRQVEAILQRLGPQYAGGLAPVSNSRYTAYLIRSDLRYEVTPLVVKHRTLVPSIYSVRLEPLALTPAARYIARMLNLIMQTALSTLKSRRVLALENLALRHQIAVLQRGARRPRLTSGDRTLWIILSRFWADWRKQLVIVQPETVIRWHRDGFRLYWRWKSRPRWTGRPQVRHDVRDLIRDMSRANPLWGAPRIHGELLKLGIEVGQATVSKYMVRHRKPPSQNWRTFLKNHAQDIASVDFFTVPTATFRVLFVLLVLSNDRRRVIHFNVTNSPTVAWTGQQIVEAFPWDTAPRYMIRDRDGIFGGEFTHRVESMGIEQVLIAARSPWQNPYVERLIGSIRRECLDHVIIFNERHLRRVLKDYFRYYHEYRTHLGLRKDCPEPRSVEPPKLGPICAEPIVGGLHHRYCRRAA